uniref:Uncharacterized protein n=1 Tax=Klebsiella phage PMBT63 TaxID=3229739 RepID=A0AB39C320_9CAUD
MTTFCIFLYPSFRGSCGASLLFLNSFHKVVYKPVDE